MHCETEKRDCAGVGRCYCDCAECLNTQEPGKLFLGEDEGGKRHFLDGEPIHCGTGLEMLVAGKWVPVCYESEMYSKPARAVLYATPWGDEGPRVTIEYPMAQTLRWPKRR